uniref:DUF4136 domain-containing protein n=1 Tax=uncultured Altererythrobacter sp. TaxID=500840 RepID=UPI0026394963|nr:DUF4136 domain-containing protein [uncultured Altererythrobacter sp.]
MRAKILLAVASLALSACATTGRINTDFDQTQDFSEYATFAWAGKSPMVVMGSRMVPALVQAEIAKSIKEDLQSKGYRYTQNLQEADFAVSFTIGTRDGVNVVEMPDYFWQSRANWTWGNPYWPRLSTMPPMRTEVREYTEGTLAVDIYDVARRAPVWHGAGQRNLTRAELRGERNTAKADVQLILDRFPPQ